jgi:hypothetical protein
MSTFTLGSTTAKNSRVATGDFVTPAYALREIPMPSSMPKDEVGRDIAFLLAKHPEIASKLGDINLDAMAPEAKIELLHQVRGRLGIQPILRRRLGYVGP